MTDSPPRSFVLGPLVEENFRRALLLSHGDLLVFVEHPISAVFIAICALLIVVQVVFAIRGRQAGSLPPTLQTVEERSADFVD